MGTNGHCKRAPPVHRLLWLWGGIHDPQDRPTPEHALSHSFRSTVQGENAQVLHCAMRADKFRPGCDMPSADGARHVVQIPTVLVIVQQHSTQMKCQMTNS